MVGALLAMKIVDFFVNFKNMKVFICTFLITILSGCFGITVRQQEEAIIEKFGKFDRIAKPGLNFKWPFIERDYEISLKVQQLDVKAETKTKDDVFVTVHVSVQFYVNDVYKAFYKLANARAQISAYIFDVVRSEVPKMTLDQVFAKKNDIAQAVKVELTEEISGFGYNIVQTLVTDIDPDQKVKDAMNEINAATRLRSAALQKGEAEKILIVKRAEADAESKALQGKGIAQQRIEIAKGMEESLRTIAKFDKRLSEKEVLSMLLITQYFDTLKSLGNAGSNTIFVSTAPSAPTDLQAQIIAAMKSK